MSAPSPIAHRPSPIIAHRSIINHQPTIHHRRIDPRDPRRLRGTRPSFPARAPPRPRGGVRRGRSRVARDGPRRGRRARVDAGRVGALPPEASAETRRGRGNAGARDGDAGDATEGRGGGAPSRRGRTDDATRGERAGWPRRARGTAGKQRASGTSLGDVDAGSCRERRRNATKKHPFRSNSGRVPSQWVRGPGALAPGRRRCAPSRLLGEVERPVSEHRQTRTAPTGRSSRERDARLSDGRPKTADLSPPYLSDACLVETHT